MNLKPSTVGLGRVLEFLDMTVFPSCGDGTCGPLLTALYDKRRLPQFSRYALGMRFPAADSMLAWSCKLNVFDAQFVRMAGIITDVVHFQTEITLLLVEMIRAGYPSRPLFRRLRYRCHTTPVLFGVARGTASQSHVGRMPRGMYPDIRAAVTRAVPGLILQ